MIGETIKAQIKKDLIIGILNTGSNNQKERFLETAEKAYEFCISHLDKANIAPNKRGVRKKKADK